MPEIKHLRCAVYTRVSTDAGLEQDFNSLDAQREAAEAYIKSQSHEGWRLITQMYSDGGYSGGNLDRPSLQRLLQDVRDRKVDVIVVYKVDRLTRSLADFAKLVELLDQSSASFVSVTQAFNTTTSMGRLTLNVLLSFAQFEREVTAERIRDKIAASKRKGLWMGGNPPLGYRVRERKLVVDVEEAETVRVIFRKYLELGSTQRLLEYLHRAGIRTRVRQLSAGKTIGGGPFMRGALNTLLRNRMYIGELNHHNKSYPGEHEAIIDCNVFEAVQAHRIAHVQAFHTARKRTDALLAGKIFGNEGALMTPSFTVKNGVRYRYYISRFVVEGRRQESGSVSRVSASALESDVVAAIRNFVGRTQSPLCVTSLSNADLIKRYLHKVVVHSDRLEFMVSGENGEEVMSFAVPWHRPPARVKREILLPHVDTEKDSRPIRNETRAAVVRAIAVARCWLSELASHPALTIEEMAKREGRSTRSVQMLLSLNSLSPEIVRAILEGKLPRGIGITRLINLPLNWQEQRAALGLAGTPTPTAKQRYAT